MHHRIERWRETFTSEPFHPLLIDILEAIMTTQADIDARTASIAAGVAQINDAVVAVKAEIDGLKAAIPADLDLSGLDSAVASLGDAAIAAASVVPSVPIEPTPIADAIPADVTPIA